MCERIHKHNNYNHKITKKSTELTRKESIKYLKGLDESTLNNIIFDGKYKQKGKSYEEKKPKENIFPKRKTKSKCELPVKCDNNTIDSDRYRHLEKIIKINNRRTESIDSNTYHDYSNKKSSRHTEKKSKKRKHEKKRRNIPHECSSSETNSSIYMKKIKKYNHKQRSIYKKSKKICHTDTSSDSFDNMDSILQRHKIEKQSSSNIKSSLLNTESDTKFIEGVNNHMKKRKKREKIMSSTKNSSVKRKNKSKKRKSKKNSLSYWVASFIIFVIVSLVIKNYIFIYFLDSIEHMRCVLFRNCNILDKIQNNREIVKSVGPLHSLLRFFGLS